MALIWLSKLPYYGFPLSFFPFRRCQTHGWKCFYMYLKDKPKSRRFGSKAAFGEIAGKTWRERRKIYKPNKRRNFSSPLFESEHTETSSVMHTCWRLTYPSMCQLLHILHWNAPPHYLPHKRKTPHTQQYISIDQPITLSLQDSLYLYLVLTSRSAVRSTESPYQQEPRDSWSKTAET